MELKWFILKNPTPPNREWGPSFPEHQHVFPSLSYTINNPLILEVGKAGEKHSRQISR